MALLGRNHQHTHHDRSLAPALTVNPGEEVTFETEDACYGQVRTLEQYIEYRKQGAPLGDPLTGPVAIEGAEPGDTLVVEVLSVELIEGGFQLIGPDRGIIADEIPEWTCYDIGFKAKSFVLANGMEIPADPVIGAFGNAPAGEPINVVNPLGGNCDVPAVRTGCKLYIPIEVPGALFSLGDVHACQGDGEVVGAPEVRARVTVRFALRDGRHSEWFMIEDAEYWHSACSAENESKAAKLAVLQNAGFIAKNHNVELKDALILLTLIGKLSISRTGKWGNQEPVVCSSFSKEQVKQSLNMRR